MKRYCSLCFLIGFLHVCSCSFEPAKYKPPEDDVDSPSVVSISPFDGENSISVVPTISVAFSEEVGHIGAELAFSLSYGGSNSQGTFSWSDNTMMFHPANELKDFATYSIKVLGGLVTGTSGKVMLNSFRSTFTTGVDTHQPIVIRIAPEPRSVDVSRRTVVEVEFSEPMETAAVQQAFTLSQSGSPVSGQFSWSGNAMRFQPNVALIDLNTYDVDLTTAATDDSSNPLKDEIDISFTVGAVINIAAGNQHSLAAMSGGTVKVWGYNNYGQVGPTSEMYVTTPISIAGLSNVVDVAGGRYHSVALLSDGTIRSWGLNDEGQLGNGSNITSSIPVMVNGVTNAIAIASGVSDYLPEGGNHTIALLSDGTVVAWGSNDFGQLGNTSTFDSNVPVAVNGITDAVAIAAGGHHCLAVLSDGTIKAWGRNSYGALGNSSVDDSATPVTVGGIATAVAVAAGKSHSLALLSNGTVKAWGDSSFGQLGPSPAPPSWFWSPVTVELMPYTQSIAAGAYHSAIVRDNHTINTWGANLDGQLGTGDISQRNPFPKKVVGIELAVKVAGGKRHTLALLSDGRVMAWGRNNEGELGDGSRTGSSSPVMVIGF